MKWPYYKMFSNVPSATVIKNDLKKASPNGTFSALVTKKNMKIKT